MYFDTGGIQTHNIHLDLDDAQLLQTHKCLLQHILLCPAVYPNFIFGGRLGEHRDYTMAEAIAAALKKAEELTSHI